MDHQNDTVKTVCFTGKRPKDLFGYEKGRYTALVDRLTLECIRLAGQGYGLFISGVAQGRTSLRSGPLTRRSGRGSG